jgi:hypothetical protein
MKRTYRSLLAIAWVLPMVLSGCSEQAEEPATSQPPVMTAVGDSTYRKTPSELRRELRANEMAKFEQSGNDIVGAKLFRSGVKKIDALRDLPLVSIDLGMTEVSDLSPLKGMPLKEVVLENTPVSDLSALQGMELEVLKLQNTKVTDLSPVADMPLKQLNLMGLPISDLSVVREMPLEILWVPGTQVASLEALSGMQLVSLDIQGTEVTDLSPLASLPRLRRLNIADTPVSDLSPLKSLQLERITLSPERITSGFEILRSMQSLQEIQTSMDAPTKAEDFWKRYDLGVYSVPDVSDPQEGKSEEGTTDQESPAANTSNPDSNPTLSPDDAPDNSAADETDKGTDPSGGTEQEKASVEKR